MGFFTRHPKDDADSARRSAESAGSGGQPPLQRRRNPAAAQRDNAANELRRRARRRLVGAIAMVLAAVIVLPMILDSPPDNVPDDIAIEIPSQNAPFEPRFAAAPQPPELPAGEGNDATQGVTPLPAAPGEPAASATDPRVPASIATVTPLPGSKPTPSEPEATRKPEPPARTETPSPPVATPARPPANTSAPASVWRVGVGAGALAFLVGCSPSNDASSSAPSATPAAGGGSRYAVQVAAVRSRSGADDLLGRLKSAGLSAYIETVKTPDGEVHRVRLGPYASRAQAETAQNRLQGLPGGYQGNLVPL
ncbi:MAG: SPOR domain-containing protein [Pigmentiphaga sp.]